MDSRKHKIQPKRDPPQEWWKKILGWQLSAGPEETSSAQGKSEGSKKSFFKIKLREHFVCLKIVRGDLHKWGESGTHKQ